MSEYSTTKQKTPYKRNSKNKSTGSSKQGLSSQSNKPSSTRKKMKGSPSKQLLNNIIKYNTTPEDYNIIFINNLLESKNTHTVAVFKDYMIADYIDEFLRRIYSIPESKERIPKFANYYKNYLTFFCKPVFCNFAFNSIIQSYGEAKAEIYYNKNYGNKKKKKKKNSTVNEKLKTIFSDTIKKDIDENSIITQTNTNILETESECTINLDDCGKILNYNGKNKDSTNASIISNLRGFEIANATNSGINLETNLINGTENTFSNTNKNVIKVNSIKKYHDKEQIVYKKQKPASTHRVPKPNLQPLSDNQLDFEQHSTLFSRNMPPSERLNSINTQKFEQSSASGFFTLNQQNTMNTVSSIKFKNPNQPQITLYYSNKSKKNKPNPNNNHIPTQNNVNSIGSMNSITSLPMSTRNKSTEYLYVNSGTNYNSNQHIETLGNMLSKKENYNSNNNIYNVNYTTANNNTLRETAHGLGMYNSHNNRNYNSNQMIETLGNNNRYSKGTMSQNLLTSSSINSPKSSQTLNVKSPGVQSTKNGCGNLPIRPHHVKHMSTNFQSSNGAYNRIMKDTFPLSNGGSKKKNHSKISYNPPLKTGQKSIKITKKSGVQSTSPSSNMNIDNLMKLTFKLCTHNKGNPSSSNINKNINLDNKLERAIRNGESRVNQPTSPTINNFNININNHICFSDRESGRENISNSNTSGKTLYDTNNTQKGKNTKLYLQNFIDINKNSRNKNNTLLPTKTEVISPTQGNKKDNKGQGGSTMKNYFMSFAGSESSRKLNNVEPEIYHARKITSPINHGMQVTYTNANTYQNKIEGKGKNTIPIHKGIHHEFKVKSPKYQIGSLKKNK